MIDIQLATGVAKKGDKEGIRMMFETLFDFDADFTGWNGIEYLWEEAEGYESSCDYLIDEVLNDEKYPTIEDKAMKFIKEFMEHEGNYYHSCEYNIIENDDEVIVTAAFVSEQ